MNESHNLLRIGSGRCDDGEKRSTASRGEVQHVIAADAADAAAAAAGACIKGCGG